MKTLAIFSIALTLATGFLALDTVVRESRKADAAAVSAVTGYLSGTNPVTLQDLVRCESVDPELLRRAMERINAAR